MRLSKLVDGGAIALVAVVVWMVMGPQAARPPHARTAVGSEPPSREQRPTDAPDAPASFAATPESIDAAHFVREQFPQVGIEQAKPDADGSLRTFVDADGQVVRTLRMDPAGRILAETRFRDGESLAIEQQFFEDGRLLRRRVVRNGYVVSEQSFR